MTSVFVTSQSSCFFLSSREQIRLVEKRLKGYKGYWKFKTNFPTACYEFRNISSEILSGSMRVFFFGL